MTCDSAEKLIPLYYYGELTPDEEEWLDEHLHACSACVGTLEGHRALADAMERHQTAVPGSLLEECRADLFASLHPLPLAASTPRVAWWRPLLASMAAFPLRYRTPLGAMALVAIGFFGARLGNSPSFPPPAAAPDQIFSTVRSVQPDPSGGVQIAFDETRRRTVSGRMEDDNIRRLLLAGARDDNNAAVRVESVDLLRGSADSDDVRRALLNALAHDTNTGVRLKALEGLKSLGADPIVRKTLAQALLTDDSPAVRMQVVDLLVAHRDDSMVGMLQNLVQKENNSYVRLKCEKALKDMNASIGTF